MFEATKSFSRLILLGFATMLLSEATPAVGASRKETNAITVTAFRETLPVPHSDDAADDPAIWIHPAAPELSLILGTDKQGGLHIYNLDGTERAVVADKSKPNNVDVLYGFKLRERTVDLAVMTTRGEQSRGVQVWAIDPQSREFSDVTADGTIQVLPDDEPYGCCTYRSPRTGAAHIFVTSKSGAVEQYTLKATDDGRVTAQKVSGFKLRSAVEACVADEEFGVVYVGEEQRGIWKISAEPVSKPERTLIAKAGENGLHVDVEGLAIYFAPGGRGYLIASSQGNNTFKVYERGGNNRFITTIAPVAGQFGDVEDTDGIAVSSYAISPLFPHGLFIAQDGKNSPAKQNFKLYRWEDIAGTNLLIDTSGKFRR